MKNWLIVANATRARVLTEADPQADPSAHYHHFADLVHTESRQKGVELATDRPGHMPGGGFGPTSSAGTSYPPRTDPREREHDRFAQQVAGVISAAVADGSCAGFVLVASNPFLGHVKAHLSRQAAKALLRTVPSDYTALTDDELARRLAPTAAA